MVHAAQNGGKPQQQQQRLKLKQLEQAEDDGRSPPPQPPPPDGGWGWVVVFASFMVHVITDGVTYSYGVFHVKFIEYFAASDAEASWVASLLVGVTYCSGPISSFFVNKFGCRLVTCAGTLLASGCLLASVWVESLPMLYLTAGIGTGFGFGLIYLPAIVSVTVYFEKYRSLATGIAVCGSGLGTVVFAPFISYLIDLYGGYKYSMMILSGIVLNCSVLGILFRPLEPDQTAKSTSCSLPLEGNDKLQQPGCNMRLALSQPTIGGPAAAKQPAFSRAPGSGGVMNRSDVFLRSSIHSIRKRSESLSGSQDLKGSAFRLSLRSLPISNQQQQQHQQHQQHRFSIDEPRRLEQFDDGGGGGDDDDESTIIRRMLRFSLLRDPLFIIFTLSNFCTSIGFNVPYVYLIPQAKLLGIEEGRASILLSVIGAANTLGRILLGYVSDKPWVDRLLVYNLCLTACGLATAFAPFCPSFMLLAVYASVYGFAAGAYVGLTSVCLVDLVGLERLTNAFGLVLLSQGIASFLGPPIAGALKDYTKDYDLSFYVAGGMIAISGLMLFVIPPIQKRQQLRQAQQLERLHGVT